MSQLNREIGQRLQGIRELNELSLEDLAVRLALTPDELAAYEAGERDISVSVLHNASAVLGISTTELMTGEAAKLRQYCVVRREKGIAVDRRASYDYRSLGYNFEGRAMDPYMITIPPAGEEGIHLNTHSGQEFHYCLEGSFMIRIGSHSITLGEGDSIYFDSACPHGMVAQGGKPARSLVIITM